MGVSSSTVKKPSSKARKTLIKEKFNSAAKSGILNLSNQGLSSKSDEFHLLVNDDTYIARLTILDLSGNELKQIPAELNYLVSLKSLFFSHNMLQRTRALDNLTRLTHLKLDHNDLEENTLLNLPINLIQLNLSFNHFYNYPIIISNSCTQLQVLDLSANRIESLMGIESLIELIELNLDSNNLQELPLQISKLKKLRKISLRNNNFGPFSITVSNEQSIPELFLLETSIDNIDLTGNIQLSKAMILKFKGIDKYLERRKLIKDKAYSGGALIESNLFGLD